MPVNSHNTDKAANDESVNMKPEKVELRVLNSDVENNDELTIDEEFDLGADPYNSTGRHVIIKPRIDLED